MRVFSKKGMALPLVVFVFLIISIMLASVVVIFQNNLSQAHQQEENTKAYYIALAGLELGYSAMMNDIDADPNITTLFYTTVGTTVMIDERVLLGGNVKITAMKKNIDGFDWIEVQSKGTTPSAVARTTILRFRIDNPAIVVRENS